MSDAFAAWGRRIVPLLTGVLLLLSVAGNYHFVGSSNLFPRADRSVVPIGNGDFSLQYYYATLGSRFLAQTGALYGYDPRFLSGYVKTPVYYPSSVPFEYAVYLFPGLPPALVFNWSIFVMLVLCPFLLYRAMVNFGLGPVERLVPLALLLLPPQLLEPHLWLYAIMQAAGMIAFIFASFASVYTVSLVYRFLVLGRWSAVPALALAAPLLFTLHPSVPVFTAAPVAFLYLSALRQATLRQHLAMWSIAALIAAVMAPWLEGYLLFRHYSDFQAFAQDDAQGHFSAVGGSILGPVATFLRSPTLFARIPLVLGVAGLLLWRKAGDTRLRFFTFQILVLTAVTYYGDRFGLASLAPGRFVLPLALYLFFPTAVAAVAIARWGLAGWRTLATRLSPPQRRPVAVAALLLLPALLYSTFAAPIRNRATLPGLQIDSGYTSMPGRFAGWLESHTDRSGRILHEETSRYSYQYYGTYLAALLPLHMNREFANGPAPFPLLKQSVFRFLAGHLQERPIDEVDPAQLAAMMERYNVRWVVCWTDAAKTWFGSTAAKATPVSTFDKFQLYRIDGEGSFFLKGSGTVAAEPNAIDVAKALPEDDMLVLRYHWDENLHAPPPAELFPFAVPGDPVPFIGVRRPPSSFRISFRY